MATSTKRAGPRRGTKRPRTEDQEIFQGNTYNTPKGKPQAHKGGKAQTALGRESRAFFSSQISKGTKKDSTNELKVLPVPVEQEEHPPYPNLNPQSLERFPVHEFTMGLISPKGCGKTTLIANILKWTANYFHTIIIMSPTLHSDNKWKTIKTWPLRRRNKELEKFLENQKKKEYQNKIPIVGNAHGDRQLGDSGKFDPKIPKEYMIDDYDEEILQIVMKEQEKMIEYLEHAGQSKHMANRILYICDDLVGSSLFGNQRDNLFKGLNTRHRHYNM